MLGPTAPDPAPDHDACSVLRLLVSAGGYFEGVFADAEALAECIANGWVMPEGLTGHALTVEGRAALRARGAARARQDR